MKKRTVMFEQKLYQPSCCAKRMSLVEHTQKYWDLARTLMGEIEGKTRCFIERRDTTKEANAHK